MIVGELLDITAQAALNSRLVQALKFLSSAALADLPDGQVEIAGSQVYAILSTYHSRQMVENIDVEGHRRYLDLQYITQGDELIGWVPEAAVPMKSLYDFERDAWSGCLPADKLSWIHLTRGIGMLLYPNDGHAPQYALGEPSLVRKVVVKIAY